MRPVLLSLFLLLASCSSPNPTATPSLTTFSPTVQSETSTPVNPSPAPPTPTVIPITLGYVGAQPRAGAVREAAQLAAQEFGWSFEVAQDVSPESLRALARSGADVIVADGAALEAATPAVAAEFPQTYFIGVEQGGAEADLPPNLLILGGPLSREDQAGFVAGLVAGFATQTRVVTVIGYPGSVEGQKYRNGFLHGVRYACPKCRVDFIDVANPADGTEASQQAALYASLSSDVFFAAAGDAGNEALGAAARQGAWVIGSGADVYAQDFGGGSQAGADRVLTSVYLDASSAIYAALTAFKEGKPLVGVRPFSATNGSIALAPYRDPDGALSMLDQQDIAAALARLADGSLETGIDPVTGEER